MKIPLTCCVNCKGDITVNTPVTYIGLRCPGGNVTSVA